MTAQPDRLEKLLEQLFTAVEQLPETSDRQTQTAERQQQPFSNLVLAEQARAIGELTRGAREAVVA
ncbi:MAG: hypothetical protein KME26_10965 [Oscillatoria princeps RMCB-10]|jgi:hypothetical protein|nr:hypothetical protein [Oscillatoria princeps RMCB-10]